MIKNIVNIYKRDIKTMLGSRAVFLTILGMCVLPCLYTLINVEAIWDPYSSVKTSDILIAVVNNDKGTRFQGKNLNLGNNVVDNLRKNHSIGWRFVNSGEADRGLLDGKYYAVIEIPEDFSLNITSIAGDSPRKAQVFYKANTKRSPMAIKITDNAASSLVDSIKYNFIYSVNKTIFSYLNIIGRKAEKNKYNIITLKDSIIFLGDNMDFITAVLGGINDSSNNLLMLLVQLKPVVSALYNTSTIDENNTANADFIRSIQSSFNNSIEDIQMELNNAEANAYRLEALAGNSSNIDFAADKIDYRISALNSEVDSVMNFLKAVNNFNYNTKIARMLDSLKDIKNSLDNLKQQLNNKNGSVVNSVSDVRRKLTDLSREYLDEVKGPLNSTADDLVNSLNDSADILNAAKDISSHGVKSLDILIDGSRLLADSSKKLENNMNEFKGVILDISSRLKLVSNNDIVKIITVFQNNPGLMGNFISNPFNIVEENIYRVPNFGSAFAPTYMTLSIWIGCTMLVAVLKTTAVRFKGTGYITLREGYLGKMLLFVSLSAVQSLIVVFTTKFILHVYTRDFFLMIMIGLISSFTFSTIVYTLVSIFGNLGKAAAVVLVVAQIAGSGATYPVQLVPLAFRIIQPLFPFTYSVSGFREAVGGPLVSTVIIDVSVLFIMASASILAGLFLKRPLYKMTGRLHDKFVESGFGE
ncbi:MULTISPECIES: YhgE/Pip domain-containing protein [Clostridium]|uniref:YhgE/Pip family protein n=1 Tax=Clostridium lapidicellarium TaxID=3240931 RepID=A0ABV4E0U6_9CLOT|nr:YhgE/Pip domain-containing protein [uncultured Clostridium sp.]